MNRTRLGFLLFVPTILLACAPLKEQAATPVGATPTPAGGTVVTGAPSGVAACYYVWTSQELPALSQVVQNALQGVADGAMGSAYAYGEDCVAADGTRTFSPMETDFRASLPTADLKDEQELGNLIAATMRAITQIPKDQLEGPQPGRVEFEFHATTGGSLRFTVEIDRYLREATGLSGARLFRLFHAAP